MTDLKFAIRQLLKNPGFTAIAVLTLALGIGANTAIFGLMNELLLRPLPIKDPETLQAIVLVDETRDFAGQNIPYPIFRDYREQTTNVLADLSAYATVFASAEVAGEPRFAITQLAAPNFFSTLGITPALGRFMVPSDDQSADQGPLVVLSHATWRSWFNADPDVIGKTVILRPAYVEPLTCSVIGVAPPGFRGLDQPAPQLWIPAVMEEHFKRASSVNFRMIGRLAPGISHDRGRAALDVVASNVADKHGGRVIPGYGNEGIFRSDLRTELRHAALGSWGAFRPHGTLRRARLLALGIAGLVLLIACANIANLLLARAERNQKQTAIRLALGASRGRILRLSLTETLLLSLMGGAVGLCLAHFGNRMLIALKPAQVDLLVPTTIDLRVAGVSLLIALFSGLIVGCVPAWRGSRQDPNLALKGQPGQPHVRGFHLRDGFAVMQIALSLILLAGAGLCVRSFTSLLAVNPGFNSRQLLVVPVDFRNVPEAATSAHYRDLVGRLSALPGIDSVSWTRVFPMLRGGGSGGISVPVDAIEGYQPKPDEFLNIQFTEIAPDYFETMGIPIAIAPDRSLNSKGSMAWVNEAFVRRYWPGQNPVGRRVGMWLVEGVVKDSRIKNLWEPPIPYLFRQVAEPKATSGVLMVRTRGNPNSVLNLIRSELLALDPELDLSGMMPMREVIRRSLRGQQFMVTLLGAFSVCALLLAVIGIYGVMSYLVSQRVRDIGIRLALGARRGEIMTWVLRHGMALTFLGLALGLAGSWAATQLLASLLFGISPTDPPTFAAVSALLVMAALLVCWFPARRAAKTDPMEALRQD